MNRVLLLVRLFVFLGLRTAKEQGCDACRHPPEVIGDISEPKTERASKLERPRQEDFYGALISRIRHFKTSELSEGWLNNNRTAAWNGKESPPDHPCFTIQSCVDFGSQWMRRDRFRVIGRHGESEDVPVWHSITSRLGRMWGLAAADHS